MLGILIAGIVALLLMRYLCVFMPHEFQHVFNVTTAGQVIGIYQCEKCMKIATGRRKNEGYKC